VFVISTGRYAEVKLYGRKVATNRCNKELKVMHNYKIAPKSIIFILIATFVFCVFNSSTSFTTEIIKNKIEDLAILTSGAAARRANVLTLLDLSASMQTDFGGVGSGEWDGTTIISACESYAGGTGTFDQRSFASHCAENVAGTSVCGSKICQIGVCDTQEEFDALVACVIANQTDPSMFDSAAIFNAACQGPSASDCQSWFTKVSAAASLEFGSTNPLLTQCP